MKSKFHARGILYVLMAVPTLALFYFYIFYNPHRIYSGVPDAASYLATAENLFNGNGLYEATTVERKPVDGPQFGISLIEFLIMGIGVKNHTTVWEVAATISYLSFLFSSYILYRIARRLAIPELITMLIVANYLFSGNIFFICITPINDGIGLTFMLLLIALFIHQNDNPSKGNLLLLTLTCIISSHFRIQCLLVPACGAFASLLSHRYKDTFKYIGITTCSALLLFAPYWYWIENGDRFRRHLLNHLAISTPYQYVEVMYKGMGKSFSITLLKFGQGAYTGAILDKMAPLFFVVGLLIIYFLWKVAQEKPFEIKLVALVGLSTLMMAAFLNKWVFRQLLVLMPIMFVLLAVKFMRAPLLKYLFGIYLFYSLCIIAIRVVHYDSFFLEQAKHSERVMPLFANKVVLISESPETSYMIFHRKAYPEVPSQLNQNDYLFFGSDDFIARQIGVLREEIPNLKVTDYGSHWRVADKRYSLQMAVGNLSDGPMRAPQPPFNAIPIPQTSSQTLQNRKVLSVVGCVNNLSHG